MSVFMGRQLVIVQSLLNETDPFIASYFPVIYDIKKETKIADELSFQQEKIGRQRGIFPVCAL